jgi:hypothetical protein
LAAVLNQHQQNFEGFGCQGNRPLALPQDPVFGVQAEVAKAYAMPPNVIERAKQALIYKPR